MWDQNFRIWKNYTLLFIFLLMLSNFFPGSYNVDTWYMWFEMAELNFSDWHSPFMGLLWRSLYIVTDRFFSLYLFQMSWYFLFFHLTTNLIKKKWITVIAVACSVLLVFIPQYLMKDVHMTLSWCSALILLLNYNRSPREIYRWGALALIAYGLLLRPNTVPAVWPLLLVWLDTFKIFTTRRLVKYVTAFVVSCILFILYYVVLHGILHARPAYFTYKYRLADVLGISVMSGENFMPGCVTSFKGYDEKKVKELYTPATNDNIYFAADTMIPPPTAELDACVKDAWVRAIKAHPFVYLKSRAIGYVYYLKIINRVPRKDYWNVMVYVIRNNWIPIDDHHTPLTQKMIRGWNKLDKVFFFDPWLWLLFNIILTILFVRRYRRRQMYPDKVHIALQLTCIIYQLGLFPFYQIDLDFRFSYLNLVSVCIGSFFYLDDYRKDPVTEATPTPES
jgi:hypothetical protein